MGMSSSQARLLSLTSRMHDIEYKAQNLEAQKLQMANESDAVYKEYENALNATKVQIKQLNSDGSIYYKDATYNLLIANGYKVEVNGEKRIPVDQATADNFVAAGGSEDYFVALQTGRVTETNQTVDGFKEIYTAEQFMNMSTTGKYRLMSNIDLTGKNWTPKSFGGTLDGNGYSITGLTKNLFSSLTNGANISNLSLGGDISTSSSNFGMLANTVSRAVNIENISLSGNISSTYQGSSSSPGFIGALIGYTNSNSDLTIKNVSSNVDITSTSSYVFAGGILGKVMNSDLVVSGSKYKGTINLTGTSKNTDTEQCVGGIIAVYQADSGRGSTEITNCSSDLVANTTFAYSGTVGVGGIVGAGWGGNASDHIISNCETNLTSNSELNRAGGIGGYLQGQVENCYSNTNITNSHADAVAGGIVAANYGNVNNSYSDVSITNNVTSTGNGTIVGHNNTTGSVTNSSSSNTSVNEVGRNNGSNDINSADRTQITCNATGASTSVNETVDNAGAQEARNLYQQMKSFGYFVGDQANNPVAGYEDDSSWLSSMLIEGLVALFKLDNTTGEYYQTNIATDTNLQEVQDETDLKKAEAKYEADMRKINSKDKKFDTDLAALESERNAIKTEMDTLKTVIKDNVDMTFKLFS